MVKAAMVAPHPDLLGRRVADARPAHLRRDASGAGSQGVDQMDYYVDLAPHIRVISVTTDRDTLPGEQHTHTGGYQILGSTFVSRLPVQSFPMYWVDL